MAKKKRQRILADHKQLGKRFIPPLRQIGKFESIKWQLPILPELLWLALLNATHGLRIGAELALAPARAASQIIPHQWFAPASAYALLTDEQQKQLLATVAGNDTADLLRKALNDLVWFYPNCPLKFLFQNGATRPENEHEALAKFKSVVAELYCRTERTPMMMQANAVYIAFVTDILKVAPHVSLANFPEIANYPHTPESERIGSGVRALVTGFFGVPSYDRSTPWPSYFWNRGLELEPCDYGTLDEGSKF